MGAHRELDCDWHTEGTLQVALIWDNNNDVEPHVTEPANTSPGQGTYRVDVVE